MKPLTIGISLAAIAIAGALAVVPAAAIQYGVKIVPKNLHLKVGETEEIRATGDAYWSKIVTADQCSKEWFKDKPKEFIRINHTIPRRTSEEVELTLVLTGKTPGRCSIIFRVVDRRGVSGGQDTAELTITE